MKSTPQLGTQGDFITAPMMTPLFGHALANQVAEIFKHQTHPELFEFGAGTGQLCIDLLTQLEILNILPQKYHILELSGALKAQQQTYIKQHLPHLFERILWHDTLPQIPFEGVIIANEVLDAMPVHRFLIHDGQYYESMVSQNESGNYQEDFEPIQNPRLSEYIRRYVSPEITPYTSEANLWIGGWLERCFQLLKSGVVLLLDYGFPAHEYYHPDRATGTLMCHYQHEAHPNPFAHPGDEDITAHVNFTHVADAGLSAGFEVSGYTNQASFLVSLGLLSLLEALQNDASQTHKHLIQTTQAVKKLLDPHQMGELFKVMGLCKNYNTPLLGFQFHDKRHSLGA